jgi:hypothetical protein
MRPGRDSLSRRDLFADEWGLTAATVETEIIAARNRARTIAAQLSSKFPKLLLVL